MTEEPERKRGRKVVEIDLLELEKLSMLHCTDEDLAAWFGVSTRTIEKRRKNPEFAAVTARGRAKGRISVRRSQMKGMEGGHAGMGIWLGKQWLGQREGGPSESAGNAAQPPEMPGRIDLSQLTDDELDQLRPLVLKIQIDPAVTPDTGAKMAKSRKKAA